MPLLAASQQAQKENAHFTGNMNTPCCWGAKYALRQKAHYGLHSTKVCFLTKLEKEKSEPLPTGIGFGFLCFGGDKRDRTADLLNAIQALS